MNETYKPVPVRAILSAIEDILTRGVGQEFNLEIYERPHYNNEAFNSVTIELSLKIPAPTAPAAPEKQPAFSA